MTAKVTYTEQQKQELIDLYQNQRVPVSRIVALGKFPGKATTIRKYLRSLGVPTLVNKSSITNFETDIIEPWKQGESLNSLSKRFNTTKSFLSKQLKSLGYQVNNTQTQINFDDTVFDSIDNEEKAYWLGFIWADGCVVNSYVERKSCSVEIGISVKDFNHLEKFCEFIGLPKDRIHTRQIKETTVNGKLVNPGLSCRVQLSSKHMWNQLVNLGCCPNKTYNEIFPCLDIFKTPDLIHHFIRGFFDGDGWVYIDCQNHLITGICGQEQFLIELKKLLPVKLQNISLYKVANTEMIRVLKWAVDNSKIFLNYIYKDATIWLDRKFNISAPYISNSISKSVNIGETPEMDNTEITIETKESVAS